MLVNYLCDKLMIMMMTQYFNNNNNTFFIWYDTLGPYSFATLWKSYLQKGYAKINFHLLLPRAILICVCFKKSYKLRIDALGFISCK